jgi:hypothetical protein
MKIIFRSKSKIFINTGKGYFGEAFEFLDE